DAIALETQIENGLEEALGYPVGSFVRTPAEIEAVKGFDFEEGDRKVWVAFLKRPLSNETATKVLALQTDSERLVVQDREVFWIFKVPYNESTIASPLGKLIGNISTSRNITTVRKIAAKLA